ncbi:hypothetical protein [Clostridium sp. Marseille-P299]|uniref:hypothetical protein n=1 Tax=Clostridium sp. Marseille-P299 TaxID=1805477 RepID=UPI0008296C17|nr:hypothetical protein [Clostridium sp. Marseille-P299]
MGKGWIALDRKIQDHWIWSKEKPFDVRSAWFDLLLAANYKDNKFPLGSEMVNVKRGSFITSERKLGEKWGWSNTRVRNFLKLLESDGMIVKKTDSKKSTITIVNYSVYQDVESSKKSEEQQEESSEASQEKQSKSSRASQEHTNNKDITKDNKELTIDIKEEEGEIQDLPFYESTINDYQRVADMYNEICISFPRVTKLSDARKKAIRARLKVYSLADFQNLFEMAESSKFLKGSNDRNWSANFDWLIKDVNMLKVLEGNYKDKLGITTLKSVNKGQQIQDEFVRNMEAVMNEYTGIR